MKTFRFLPVAILVFAGVSCKTSSGYDPLKATKEIADAEKAFADMARDKSISEAFAFYADSNAVIKRENDTLIHGREAIRQYYTAPFYTNAKVNWGPDHIEVSQSGDLGHAYGRYVWQSKDSTGKLQEFKGVYHTVWKRQADGSWKYVWD